MGYLGAICVSSTSKGILACVNIWHGWIPSLYNLYIYVYALGTLSMRSSKVTFMYNYMYVYWLCKLSHFRNCQILLRTRK